METHIDSTRFGSISVNGKTFDHDIIINLRGEVKKRKKKLSKRVCGTSHTVSLEEAESVYEEGAEAIIIGSGQYGVLKLSPEATRFFSEKNCRISLHPTPVASELWNESKSKKCIALFHITC